MNTPVTTVNPIDNVIRPLRYTMLLSFRTNTSLSSASTSPFSASHASYMRFESVGVWPLLSFSRCTARPMLSFSRVSALTWFLRLLISSLCWRITFLAPNNAVHCHPCGFSTSYHLKKLQGVSEDDVKRHEGDVQKATDQAITDIDQSLAHKEKEIMSV